MSDKTPELQTPKENNDPSVKAYGKWRFDNDGALDGSPIEIAQRAFHAGYNAKPPPASGDVEKMAEEYGDEFPSDDYWRPYQNSKHSGYIDGSAIAKVAWLAGHAAATAEAQAANMVPKCAGCDARLLENGELRHEIAKLKAGAKEKERKAFEAGRAEDGTGFHCKDFADYQAKRGEGE